MDLGIFIVKKIFGSVLSCVKNQTRRKKIDPRINKFGGFMNSIMANSRVAEAPQVMSTADAVDLFEVDFQTVSMPDHTMFGNMSSVPCIGTAVLMC